MNVSETVIHHASDWIDWIDASGALTTQRRITDPLTINLHDTPSDLALISHNGRSRLWRTYQDELHLTVAGRASNAQMSYPALPAFTVTGEVLDQQRLFNPRRFSLNAGDAAGHVVELYRSPMGTRFGSAGGLRGNVCYEDNSPASWAVLSVVTTPLTGLTLTFRAQADKQGDFLLAMDRLPAIGKDVTPKHYTATLSVNALATVSGKDIANPDEFVVAEVGDPNPDPPPEGDQLAFATNIDLTVSPGTVGTLTSKDRPHLVIRIP